MKKYIFLCLALVLVLVLACGMASCGEHVHVSSADGVITEPTCSEQGYTTYKCSDCGESYRGDIKDIDPTKHVITDAGVVTAPNCTEGGYTTHQCDACHQAVKTDLTEAVPGQHVVTTKKTVTAPTCTEAGFTTNTCDVCGTSFTTEPVPAVGHSRGEDKVCLTCGDTGLYLRVDEEGNESPTGTHILFGTYPQSQVSDSILIATLNGAAGAVPAAGAPGAWTSYGYYLSGTVSDYMWYQDIVHAGEKYRGVYFTSYRPYSTEVAGAADNSYQDDNGYVLSTVYWFKYEPISWSIVGEAGGKATLLCDIQIDAREFNVHTGTNKWAESNIRTWLNETFYQVAFSSLQQELIALTDVDNSIATTTDQFSAYYQEGANTQDRIYLASTKDVMTLFANKAERVRAASAYAKCQGIYIDIYDGDGNSGQWFLRTAYWRLREGAVQIPCVGGLNAVGHHSTSYTYYETSVGIVPMLQITL